MVFISGNSNDWCENSKECRFHDSFLGELRRQGLGTNRLLLLPNLAEFNRWYTVSNLPVEQAPARPKEGAIDYQQLLADGRDLIAMQMLAVFPDLVRRAGDAFLTPRDLGLVDISAPANVRNEPPRTLDSERRLLEFSADYRFGVDLVIRQTEVSNWIKRFNVQWRQDLRDGWVHLYATLPVRADFHMIQRGENTEQFSLASAEILGA